MLDSQTAARLDAIGKLGFTNPFGPERPRLEAIIVGEQVARSSPWSRSLDWPLEDPALPAIKEEAERQTAAAQTGFERGAAYSEQDRDLIRGAALYVLYYRHDAELYESIVAESAAETVDFYDAFQRDFRELFRHVGAAAKLRASVWESLFTHDPWRYLHHLQGRMHEASTLILGPSGTGKELVASAIGLSSYIRFDGARRRFARDFRTAFHPLNLAAMSNTLIESELFGHKKGAFTGATADRMGHLEGRTASETIFMDEIGELDPEVQVKLLRVLQSRTFHRLGDSEPRSFGGKVVAATNRDLAHEMKAGRFREDLYYRLCSDVIRTPSLKEQVASDCDELAHLVGVLIQRTLGTADSASFEEVMSGIDRSVGFDYAWPGNMRELEQCVRNLLIHGRYLPATAAPASGALDALLEQMKNANATLDQVISTYSTWVYRREGNYTRAGQILGVDRRTVAKYAGDTLHPPKYLK
jgi:transcriptional regulator with AAA-type ATPase domain